MTISIIIHEITKVLTQEEGLKRGFILNQRKTNNTTAKK